MWVLARSITVTDFEFAGRTAVISILILAAIAIAVTAIMTFRRHRTTVDPLRPEEASTLVTGGIFNLSRNPMYVALTVLLSAWCIYLADAINVLVIIAFIAYITRFQIIPEERALDKKFGDAYRRYTASVRRWL